MISFGLAVCLYTNMKKGVDRKEMLHPLVTVYSLL